MYCKSKNGLWNGRELVLSWANSLFWGEKNNSELYGSCCTFFSIGYEGKWTLLLPVFEHFKVSLSDEWWLWVFVRDASHSMHNWLYMIILVSEWFRGISGLRGLSSLWRILARVVRDWKQSRVPAQHNQLWFVMRLVVALIQGQGFYYVCLCSCSHYECWLGWDPYDLPPVPFFWWLWRNFIHLAASGSSRHLWSTIVHPLQGVTVNHWKIGRVSFGITQASLFAVNFEWWNPLEIPIPLEIYTHPPCLPVKSGLLRRVLIDNGCIPGRDVGRRA